MAMSTRTVILGTVSVDSGTLMVVDPGYLAHHWVAEDDAAPVVRLVVWGPDSDDAITTIVPQSPNLTIQPDAHRFFFRITHPDWTDADYIHMEHALHTFATTHNRQIFTQLCRLNTRDQLNERLDHPPYGAALPFLDGTPGFLVGVTTGLGDGEYIVQATLVDLGPFWGERIQRITIDFLDPTDF